LKQSFLAAAVVYLLGVPGGVTSVTAQSAPDLFAPIASVMQHPRCLNCHVNGDTPLNGDDARAHRMKITRGVDGLGTPAARCYACHREAASSTASFVPAAPNWKLAPLTMAWQGLTKSELCDVLKDPARNGNRTRAMLVHHMETDEVVGTGWHRGGGRTAVPLPRAEFVAAAKAWAAAGAPCPEP